MGHMVILNTCILLLLAITKICIIYGRTGCLFHLIVDTEDIALFYFFYELHNDLLLEPKTPPPKNKFLVSEQDHSVQEMAKMEEQRTRKSKNEVTSRHYSSIHLSISASLVYLFIYFPAHSFPDSSITVQILALMPGRVPIVASQNNVAGWDAQRRRGEKSSI